VRAASPVRGRRPFFCIASKNSCFSPDKINNAFGLILQVFVPVFEKFSRLPQSGVIKHEAGNGQLGKNMFC